LDEKRRNVIPKDSPEAPQPAEPQPPHPSAVQNALQRVNKLKNAAGTEGHKSLRIGLAGAFLVGVFIATAFVSTAGQGVVLIMVAGTIGGYMALNIGANDVANSMGPPVGSKAITMAGALVIAAVGNTAGAVLAGGDVVSTIAKGIIDPAPLSDVGIFITAMLAALLAAALWLNLATYVGAPVSTTHAIVGGVMGAGMAAIGIGSVNWGTMGAIAASWVISPVMGGLIAAAFLYFIRRAVIYQPDRIAAAKRWVPVLIGVMGAAFAMYLMIKGFKKVWKVDLHWVLIGGAAVFVAVWQGVRPLVARQAEGLENRKKAINALFAIPLICAAGLLTFAHGANDVANAVGPLAAIVGALTSGAVAAKVTVPIWVLVVGGLGISIGLALFGPRLVRTVGEKITKLNPIRAFCVALSAAITVLIASALGLPVSSTHIAVGGVFGVGFLREILHARFRDDMERAAVASGKKPAAIKGEKKKKKKKLKLVRRKHLTTIVAAWLVTVPLAAVLSAVLFFILHWGRMTFL